MSGHHPCPICGGQVDWTLSTRSYGKRRHVAVLCPACNKRLDAHSDGIKTIGQLMDWWDAGGWKLMVT